MISSALVLQERKLNVRKKFRRMRLQRKEGEKKKGAEKEMLERDDDKEKEKRKKRRGSSLRPDLAEYKVLAKARREKSKLVIGAKTCNHEGQSCKMSKHIQSENTDISLLAMALTRKYLRDPRYFATLIIRQVRGSFKVESI